MKLRLTLFLSIVFIITSITAISFAQRTQTEKPITGDFNCSRMDRNIVERVSRHR